MGLMTLNNFSSKILSFLLVPLYTSVLTTGEYGTYDLYTTTAFLLIPVLSTCISDGVLRYTLDSENNPSDVLAIGIRVSLRACFLAFILVIVNSAVKLLPVFNEYPLMFLLYFVTCLMSDVLTQFARGLERIFDVAIAGILSSLATVSLNILLLVVFDFGIRGYFIAGCSAFAITIIYLTFRLRLWRYINVRVSSALSIEIQKYSAPLILNQISWWINNASDRYIVTFFCGAAVNGVYSVAYKIPSLLSVFQTIFNQAWTISAVKELGDEGGDFVTSIYRLYNCGMVVLCSMLIMFDKPIASILFAKDFYDAWEYAPFLLLSVVFGSLSTLLGGLFTALKDSKLIAKTTALGAALNIVFSLGLVYLFGAIGAAISTTISYAVVWLIRLREAKKAVRIQVSLARDVFSYVALLVQSIVLFSGWDQGELIIELVIVLILFCAYLNDIKWVWCALKAKLQH
ncbi:polysaccharide biosynthesis protein [Collinsella sp. An2]|nr:polysaccharide biosynthesis protein [Collinsella sp. An2]